MKNYRVGFKKGGNVTDVSAGPWKEKQKPKPGPKPGPGKREKLKKGRKAPKVKPDPYRHPYPREGKEAPKVKPDPYRRGWGKLPQLKKSQKERREELRKKARKSGGHSKIIFHDEWKHIDPGLQKGLFKKDGGRAGIKKGGKSDKKWIQKAVNPKHKGYCTPMTKKTCTPARKALARTFKKKAKTGW